MRKLLFILLACCLFISCSKQPSFKDTEGNSIQLSKLNKWVVLTYWAPWCHTCMKEIPELNRFYKNNQNKNITVLGVNFENPSIDVLITDVKKSKITFPVLTSDPSNAWQIGDIAAIPMTFIINPQGKVVKQISGPVTEASLTSILDALKEPA
jgi:thiol-disulfide isomerase/thioredoxin